jgi:hypothetical protein
MSASTLKNIFASVFFLLFMGGCLFPLRQRFDTDSRLLQFEDLRQSGQGVLWQLDTEYTFRTRLTRPQSESRRLLFSEYKTAGLYILEIEAQSTIGIVDLHTQINGDQRTFELSAPQMIMAGFRHEFYLEKADTLRAEIWANFSLPPEGVLRIRPVLYWEKDNNSSNHP